MKQLALIDQKKVQDILNSLDFFGSFTAEERKRFLALQHHFVAYEPGEDLIREGTCEASFFVLLWGTVSVHRGQSSRLLARLKPGEFFGEVTFLTNAPRTASVVADAKTVAIRIDQEMLKAMTAEMREKIKDQIIQRLVQRLDSLNKALEKIPA